MPDRMDKALFLNGLLVFLGGQVAINAFGAVTRDVIPVDITHWLMPCGAALMIPFAARLPRKGAAIALAPLLLTGIVGVIGMCVIDFVFWSLPDAEFRAELARTLMDTPAVWQPFMRWGPNEIFTAGLALPSLLYWRKSRVGTVLVLLGAIVMAIGPSWFNVAGYVLITAGYALSLELMTAPDRF